MPDLTTPIVNFAVDAIGQYGLWAVFLLMILESACIPVPSEAIMLYGGFLVSTGQQDFWPIVIAGVAGNLVGSWIAYGVGRYKGREWALQFHWLHITEKRLAMADRFFERWGSLAVLVSRCLPIVRTFISLPAGVSRMPFWRFTVFTVIGCLPWVIMLTLLGRAVGDNWEELQHTLHYFDYVLILGAVGGIAWYLLRARRRRAAATADEIA